MRTRSRASVMPRQLAPTSLAGRGVRTSVVRAAPGISRATGARTAPPTWPGPPILARVSSSVRGELPATRPYMNTLAILKSLQSLGSTRLLPAALEITRVVFQAQPGPRKPVVEVDDAPGSPASRRLTAATA